MLNLELDNWACHERAVLKITDRALVFGANGSGKTAIRDALEFLYVGTGQLRGITTKKDLAKLSVRRGAKSCRVAVETDRVKLERSMRASDGTQTITRWQRATPDDHWGDPEPVPLRKDGRSPLGDLAADVVRVMLEPTAFFTLDPTRRREILITATTDQSAAEEEIVEALEAALRPDCEADTKAIEQAAGWVAKLGFREAEEKAGETRRIAKRELAALTFPERPEVDADTESILAAHHLGEFETRLQAVEKELAQAQQASARSLGTLTGSLEQARAQLHDAENADYEDEDRDAQGALDDAEEAFQKAEDAALSALEAVDRADKALEAASAAAKPFTKPKLCPAAPFEFRCTVRQETFDKARAAGSPEDAERAMTDARQASIQAQEKADAAKEVRAEAKKARQAAQERVQKEADRAKRMDAQVKVIEASRATVKELEAQVQAASKADRPDENQIGDLEDRVQRGRRMVDLKKRWDACHEESQKLHETKRTLEARRDRWDAICGQLGTDGVEKTLGGDSQDAFRALVGELESLAGQIRLTEDFDLQVDRDGTAWHPLQLSTAQRLAVGLAIQHALCSMVDFPVLVVDQLDLFDRSTRGAWSGFTKAVQGRYAAILGLCTEEKGAPAPGYDVFMCGEDGLRRLAE